MNKYIIPIECFTTIEVYGKDFEDATCNLNLNMIKDYKKTFREWSLDVYGEVYKYNENGEEIEHFNVQDSNGK